MNNNWRYALFTLAFLPVLILTAQALTLTPILIISIIASIIVAVVTFQKPENGLLIIVFSMLLSPQIVASSVSGRDLTLRIDDLLIVVMLLAWLAYTAKDKDWKGFIKTPLDFNLMFLVALYITSTGLGIISGYLNTLKSIFYMLKYLEYFVLFWVTANIVSTSKNLPKFLMSGAVTAIIVALFAYTLFGSQERVYAPFEQNGGEPASLAGYYLVVFGVLLGFFLTSDNNKIRYFCLGIFILILPTFIKTLSRASYLAFAPMVLSMLLLTKKRKSTLALMLVGGVILFPIVFSGLYSDMVNRVNVTFTGGAPTRGEGMSYKKIKDQSATDRIDSWKWVVRERLTADLKSLLIGRGVTGVGFIDGQIFTFLGEIGVVGTIAFYWMIFKIIWISYRNYRNIEDDTIKAVSLGLVGGLVGLLFQSSTTNTFIIVRINEPLWFLTALVMVAPDLHEQEKAMTAAPNMLKIS